LGLRLFSSLTTLRHPFAKIVLMFNEIKPSGARDTDHLAIAMMGIEGMFI